MPDTSTPDPTRLHDTAGRPGDVALGRAVALVRFLRERCPWDARQDASSLRPYLLEEAHEVADAIDQRDDDALAAELGDLLLNVAFQIALAEERHAFTAETVVRRLEEKMEARHPHVYGDAEQPPDWESLKREERARRHDSGEPPLGTDPFENLATGLEPLSRALRAQDRMAALGFDWPDLSGPVAKVREETDEFEAAAAAEADLEDELGDLLFAVVNAARLAGVHPATGLARASRKFERRCRAMLELARARGFDWGDATLEEMDELWEEIKAGEASGP